MTYDIATADGTAVAGSDYAARSLVGETIAAGSTSRPFGVTVYGDAAYEGNETFTVNVSNVIAAMVVDGHASGTIINDDPYGY